MQALTIKIERVNRRRKDPPSLFRRKKSTVNLQTPLQRRPAK
jgi:hypothetical protein